MRKRENYNDLAPDDLTFALFYDKVLGVGSMREDRAFDNTPDTTPKVAKKTRKGRKWGNRNDP